MVISTKYGVPTPHKVRLAMMSGWSDSKDFTQTIAAIAAPKTENLSPFAPWLTEPIRSLSPLGSPLSESESRPTTAPVPETVAVGGVGSRRTVRCVGATLSRGSLVVGRWWSPSPALSFCRFLFESTPSKYQNWLKGKSTSSTGHHGFHFSPPNMGFLQISANTKSLKKKKKHANCIKLQLLCHVLMP